MNPTLTITEPSHALTVSVTYDRTDAYDGKHQFAYVIEADGVTVKGDDLRCPRESLGEALASLLTFLGAYAEAVRYPDSDNRDLFPAELAPWAEAVDPDFLAILASDLEEARA